MTSIILSTNIHIHFLNAMPKFKTFRPPIRKTTLFLYSLVFVKALCFCKLLCALVSQFLHCISTRTSHNNTLSRCLCSFNAALTTSGKIHKHLYHSFWQFTKVNFLDKKFYYFLVLTKKEMNKNMKLQLRKIHTKQIFLRWRDWGWGVYYIIVFRPILLFMESMYNLRHARFSVCSSVRTYYCSSHWTDFCEI
jgi:hypothetical protein